MTIVARNQKKLDEALAALKVLRLSRPLVLPFWTEHNVLQADAPPSARIHAVSADVSTAEGARSGISQSCAPFDGKMADAVFLCAGVSLTSSLLLLDSRSPSVRGQGSQPGFFIEQEDDVLLKSMDMDYWTACWTAKASARAMAKQAASFATPPKIVFVSSTLGLVSIAGYASYTPAKHAIRGLSDTLRSELLLYGIDVHCFFPSGILSPGFDEENKTKPQLTKTIEGADEPSTPEACAGYLLRGEWILSACPQKPSTDRPSSHLATGIEKGEYQISYDLGTSIFRASTRGIAPYNTVLLDLVLSFVGSVSARTCERARDGRELTAPLICRACAVWDSSLEGLGRRAGPR